MNRGEVRGLARGLAWRLLEAGGAIDRRGCEADVRLLSPAERRRLKSLGVRIGAFSLFLPDLLTAEAQAVAGVFARLAAPEWRASGTGPAPLPETELPPRALGLRGLVRAGALAVDVTTLERLADLLRRHAGAGGVASPPDAALAGLGWTLEEARAVLAGLGYQRTGAGWRRRSPRQAPRKPAPSPFEALAQLSAPPRRTRRPRRRPKVRVGG
jgi:ATP-dependent RNA helicase SUPV3L1/SUV3